MRSLLLRLLLGMIAFALVSCAAAGGTLESGMTPDQAIEAMGQPDLRDSVPDPHGSSATVLRYAWVSRGKVATFGPDNRLADVRDLPPAPSAETGTAANPNAAAPVTTPQVVAAFDPVQTPLNYLFYPLKFAFTWVGAGINCVAEGQCRRPEVRPPDAG